MLCQIANDEESMAENKVNTITFQDVYQTITTRGEFKLGQRSQTPDGREWQFITTSGAIGKNLVAIPNTVTTATTVSSSSDNQGRRVYITDTDSSWTTGQFEDAIGLVYTGTGSGQTFKVRTNNATVLTLYPESALGTALAVSDSGVKIQTMSNCIIAAVTSTVQMAQGVPQVSFASGDFGWILTEGDGGVVSGGVLVVGEGFNTGDDVAGQVVVAITGKGPLDAQNLGYCIVVNSVDDQANLCRMEVRG